jgi:hypothetical protein
VPPVISQVISYRWAGELFGEMIKEMLPVGYPSELIFRGWVLVRGTYGIE